jgi:hypothetical protein
MITKEKLLAQLETFPDNVSIDELIDRLVFIDNLRTEFRNLKMRMSFVKKSLEESFPNGQNKMAQIS